MTEKEKKLPAQKLASGKSALVSHALPVCFVLIGIMQMVAADDFIIGIRSYFWKQAQGHVVSSDLISFKNTGSGEVVYEFNLDGVEVSKTATVSKEWSWGRRVKYTTWAKQYDKGELVTIFHNGSGRYLLGHWPTGVSYLGFLGIISFILAWFQFLRVLKNRKTRILLAMQRESKN